MTAPCEKTEVIEMIKCTVEMTSADVKQLLAYQNKVIGIVIGVSSTCSIIVFLITTFLKTK